MKTLKDLKEEMIQEIETTIYPYRILLIYNYMFRKGITRDDIADFEEDEDEID